MVRVWCVCGVCVRFYFTPCEGYWRSQSLIPTGTSGGGQYCTPMYLWMLCTVPNGTVPANYIHRSGVTPLCCLKVQKKSPK